MTNGISKFRHSLKRLDASNDENLVDYFQSTKTTKNLVDPQSENVLGVGLKGIGKSAAYRFLVEFDNSADVSIGVRPRDYTISIDTENLNSAACQKQFTNDLVVEALRGIADSNSPKLDTNLKEKAKAYFSNYKKLIETANGRFGGISILGCGFTVNKPESRTLVGLQAHNENKSAFDLLKKICGSGLHVRIVIDDPELIFSEIRELDTHFLGGLFLAALDLSERISNLKIVVLLKSHVFFAVMKGFEDYDKHPWSHLRFSWSRQELIDVIERRMKWAGIDWPGIFPGGNREDCRSLLLKKVCPYLRTGPRELIYWIETAIATSDNVISKSNSLDRSRRALAKYSLESLVRSHNEQYPRISEVIAQVFRGRTTENLSHAQFTEHVSTLKANDEDFRSLWRLAWLQTETPRTLAEILFKVGGLALVSEKRLVLPFEAEYQEDLFDAAEAMRLAPALAQAV